MYDLSHALAKLLNISDSPALYAPLNNLYFVTVIEVILNGCTVFHPFYLCSARQIDLPLSTMLVLLCCAVQCRRLYVTVTQ